MPRSAIDDFEPELPTDSYDSDEIDALLEEHLPPRHRNAGQIPHWIRRSNSLTATASHYRK